MLVQNTLEPSYVHSSMCWSQSLGRQILTFSKCTDCLWQENVADISWQLSDDLLFRLLIYRWTKIKIGDVYRNPVLGFKDGVNIKLLESWN